MNTLRISKTDSWARRKCGTVLDAAFDARLVYGLKQECAKYDLFFVPPETVHVIGAGALVAEIQEALIGPTG